MQASNYTAFFILSLAASGYILANFCYRFKYITARETGHRLYLTSAVLGFLVILLAEMTVLLWHKLSPLVLDKFIPNLNLPLEHDRVLTLAVLGPLISIAITALYNSTKNSKNKNLHRAWEKDDFSSLVAYVTRETYPIAVTLENGKVYVGLVARTPEPHHESAHLTLLPLYSGYREDKKMSMTLSNCYEEVFSAIESETQPDSLKNFYLVIPLERIVSSHAFNYELYKRISDQSLPA